MYSNLPTDLQNIIYFNYEYSANLFFMAFVFLFSAFYIFVYKPQFEKPTNLFSVAITRFLLTILTGVSCFLIPFVAFFINPSKSTQVFVDIYIWFYGVYLTFLILIFYMDFFRYMPFVLLKMAGMDFNDPDVTRVYNNIKKEMMKIPFLRNVK